MTFEVANVNKTLGSVLEDGREWKQSGVRCTRVVHREQCGDTLWLRDRDGVHVVDMMVAAAGRAQKSRPSSGRRGRVAGP